MRPGYEFPNNRQNPSLRVNNPIGGLSASGLALYQSTTTASPQGRSEIGTYTFTFSRPVTNLRLTLTDIDSAFGDFWDVVELSAGYTVTSQGSGLVVDNGGPGGTQRLLPEHEQRTGRQRDRRTRATSGSSTSAPISILRRQLLERSSKLGYEQRRQPTRSIFISDLTFDYKPC